MRAHEADDLLLIQFDAMKQMPIGAERVSQNISIFAVIFGNRYCVPIPKPVICLGLIDYTSK